MAIATSGRAPLSVARLLRDPNVRFGAAAAGWSAGFLLLVLVAFPAAVPILVVGGVYGALSGLVAMGLVLVYRTTRIINFAQGEIGAGAGVLAAVLVAQGWSYVWACAVGFVCALVVGALVELLVVRRFARAPRLILSVATLGVAQLLAGAQLGLPLAFGESRLPREFPTPFDFSFEWHPVVFRGNHLLAVFGAVAVCIGLGLFFRRTAVGVAARAGAESAERAAQLGIPVRRISTMVWVLAAGMSALAALMRIPLAGVPFGQVLGPAVLLRALAAAVIGRMESLPRTFAAAVALGAVEQSVYSSTGRTTLSDAVLFGVIVVALLFQRRKRSRVEDAAASSWDLVAEVRPVPPELERVPEVRWARRIGAAVLLALVVLAPLAVSTRGLNALGSGVTLAIVGVSMVVLTGWTGEISLGQMAFWGVGSAVASRLSALGWPLLSAMAVAAVAAAAVAVVVGLPALRIRGPFLAVATLAFGLAASSYFLNPEYFGWLVSDDRVHRPVLFGRIDLEDDRVLYYFMLVVLAAVLFSVRSVHRSRIGRAMVAVRDNPRAAQSYGMSVLRTRLTGFALSGFYAGVAGALFVFHQHSVTRPRFLPEESIRVFTMTVFGGLGSVPGALLGALYFSGLEYWFPLRHMAFLFSGFGLLFVLMFVRGGLSGLAYNLRDAFLRRVARRRGLVVPSLVADVRVDEPAASPPTSAAVVADGVLARSVSV